MLLTWLQKQNKNKVNSIFLLVPGGGLEPQAAAGPGGGTGVDAGGGWGDGGGAEYGIKSRFCLLLGSMQ